MGDDRPDVDRRPEAPANAPPGEDAPTLIAFESEDGVVVCDPANPRAWIEVAASDIVDLEERS